MTTLSAQLSTPDDTAMCLYCFNFSSSYYSIHHTNAVTLTKVVGLFWTRLQILQTTLLFREDDDTWQYRVLHHPVAPGVREKALNSMDSRTTNPTRAGETRLLQYDLSQCQDAFDKGWTSRTLALCALGNVRLQWILRLMHGPSYFIFRINSGITTALRLPLPKQR